MIAGGCFVPRPEHYQRIPNLMGTVVDAGAPVQGARVWYSEDRASCQPASAGTRTGADGSFQLAGLEKFRLGVVVTGGDPGQSWSLCIQPSSRGEALRQTQFIMGHEAPKAFDLRCDISRPELCERVSITR
jgi:hypothetical protein